MPGGVGPMNSVDEPVHPTLGKAGGGLPGQRIDAAIGVRDQNAEHNPNLIWITGEFFNVGRARDALYHVASQKARVSYICISYTSGLTKFDLSISE